MNESEWFSSDDPAVMLAHAQGKLSGRRLRLFACACARLAWDSLKDPRSRAAVEVAERYADGEADAGALRESFREAPAAGPEAPYWWDLSDLGWICCSQAEEGDVTIAEFFGEVASRDKGRDAAFAAPLRDIVGNPFRRAEPLYRLAKLDDSGWSGLKKVPAVPWLTRDVLSLAQAAYAERLEDGTLDPVRLAILADAVEEAGCPPEVVTESTEEYCDAFMYGCEEFDAMDACTHKRTRTVTVKTPHPLLEHLRSPGPHVRGCWVIDTILGKE